MVLCVQICPHRAQLHILVKGFWAHHFPVERLAAEPQPKHRLCSAAHAEVKVWAESPQGQFAMRSMTGSNNLVGERLKLAEITPPPTASGNRDAELLATSVHWMLDGSLMVSYMYHGIMYA